MEAQVEGFCGRDLICHEHKGCQEWFNYGPLEFTGLENNSTVVALSCSDYDTGFADSANAVTFGCRPYAFGRKAPEGTNEK